MGDLRVVALLLISISILVTGAISDAGINEESLQSNHNELQLFKTKISQLESSIGEQMYELKSKDESIRRLEKIIEEKSTVIASLQSELDSLQKKGAANQMDKAHGRSGELEVQIQKLKQEINAQNEKRSALEERASTAEKKAQEMKMKLESLRETIDEQRRRIQKTEHALQASQEELMKAQLEATSKSKELEEVHGAWLPPWVATHTSYCQELARFYWDKHVGPSFDVFIQKASEQLAHAQKWAQPHLETAKSNWLPAIREHATTFTTSTKPYVEMIGSKVVEFYHASKSAVMPHIVKAQQSAAPYLEDAKKTYKPYVDHLATVTKPHVEKVQVALKPYSKQAHRFYRKLHKSVTEYHSRVQVAVKDQLNKHGAVKPLATNEFAWIVASTLLASPVFFACRALLAIISKKGRRKQRRSTHANHDNRKHKRRHAEK